MMNGKCTCKECNCGGSKLESFEIVDKIISDLDIEFNSAHLALLEVKNAAYMEMLKELGIDTKEVSSLAKRYSEMILSDLNKSSKSDHMYNFLGLAAISTLMNLATEQSLKEVFEYTKDNLSENQKTEIVKQIFHDFKNKKIDEQTLAHLLKRGHITVSDIESHTNLHVAHKVLDIATNELMGTKKPESIKTSSVKEIFPGLKMASVRVDSDDMGELKDIISELMGSAE